MIRAPPCQGGGRGFESLHPLNQKKHQIIDAFFGCNRFTGKPDTRLVINSYVVYFIKRNNLRRPDCKHFRGVA